MAENGEYRALVIILSIVVWIIHQYVGHGVGMESSHLEEGSPQDIYLNRVEKAGGMAAVGALLSFVTQLIPITIVNMVGWVIIVISIFLTYMIMSGALHFGLPKNSTDYDD